MKPIAWRIFDVPIACIAPIDADRQWFKAKCGLATDGTGREISFCGHTILSNEPTIVGIGLGTPPERGETILRPGEEVWIHSDAAIELRIKVVGCSGSKA